MAYTLEESASAILAGRERSATFHQVNAKIQAVQEMASVLVGCVYVPLVTRVFTVKKVGHVMFLISVSFCLNFILSIPSEII